MAVSVAGMLLGTSIQLVYADEKRKGNIDEIAADEVSDSGSNEYVFDGHRLKQIKINGKVVVENDYDDNGMRIVKSGVDECRFEYDENRNLIKEERNGKVITYFYEKDEEYEYWHIIGFNYEGRNYYYTRDDGNRINGIQNESKELVAKYEYGSGKFKVSKVMMNQAGQWVCTDDSEFIGNINKIRDLRDYYDEECDLYYDEVFYSSITGHIIWNCDEDADISLLSDPYDLDYNIYCWQQSLLNDSSFNERLSSDANWHVGLSDVAVVARIIYGENTSVAVDQNAIANVIRNRAIDKVNPEEKKSEGELAREVVLEEGQFSTAAPTSIVVSRKNPDDSGWQNAVHKACLLCWTLDKEDWDSLNSIPYGMGEQKCFRSIKNNYSNFSGANPMHYDKDKYHTSAYHAYIAGYGEVNSYSTLYSIKNNYMDRNIYFSEYNY